MARTILLFGLVLVLGAAGPVSAGQLTLRFQDGYVTLSAHDVPLREILAEWARTGRTSILNGEKVTATPVTLELTRVPEKQALEVLLRSVSGYLAAPRDAYAANLSVFDRIVVMPVSTAAPPAPATPRQVPRPPYGQDGPNPPVPMQMPQSPGSPDDDPDTPVPPMPPMPQGQPGFPGPDGAFTPPGDPNVVHPNAEPRDQGPVRPYANPDENAPASEQPAPVPGPTPLGQGVVTMPGPGQVPMPQKPPQQ